VPLADGHPGQHEKEDQSKELRRIDFESQEKIAVQH